VGAKILRQGRDLFRDVDSVDVDGLEQLAAAVGGLTGVLGHLRKLWQRKAQ
jgi:hypothetical protein